jgi:hypothetical protein
MHQGGKQIYKKMFGKKVIEELLRFMKTKK